MVEIKVNARLEIWFLPARSRQTTKEQNKYFVSICSSKYTALENLKSFGVWVMKFFFVSAWVKLNWENLVKLFKQKTHSRVWAARNPLNGICCMGHFVQDAVVIIPRTNTMPANCYRRIRISHPAKFCTIRCCNHTIAGTFAKKSMNDVRSSSSCVIFFLHSKWNQREQVLPFGYCSTPFRQLQMHRCQARLVFICCSRLTQNDSEWEIRIKTTHATKKCAMSAIFIAFSTGLARFYRALKQIFLALQTLWNVAWKCS